MPPPSPPQTLSRLTAPLPLGADDGAEASAWRVAPPRLPVITSGHAQRQGFILTTEFWKATAISEDSWWRDPSCQLNARDVLVTSD